MPAVLNDVIRASVKADYDFADDVVNVFWFRLTTVIDGSDATLEVDAVAIIESLFANIAGSIGSKLAQDNVTLINKTQDEFIGEAALTTNFNGAGDVLPLQCAALVIGRTAKPRTQGRKYLGPLPEGVQQDGILTAASRIEFDAFAAEYVAPLSPASGNVWEAGVAKLGAGGVLVSFEPFKEGKALGAIRTQRRRTLGRGS